MRGFLGLHLLFKLAIFFILFFLPFVLNLLSLEDFIDVSGLGFPLRLSAQGTLDDLRNRLNFLILGHLRLRLLNYFLCGFFLFLCRPLDLILLLERDILGHLRLLLYLLLLGLLTLVIIEVHFIPLNLLDLVSLSLGQEGFGLLDSE